MVASLQSKHNPSLEDIAQLIKSGKLSNIAVLTGAGISTSAGIPDFRSPETGLYANLQALNLPYPEAVFSLDYFEHTPEPFWTLAKELYPGKHFPTPTHYFLALLHAHGLLRRVFSQNIDTLETAAGLPDDLVIEAHGSFRTAHCIRCRQAASTEHVLSSGVRRGHVVRCARTGCEGLVKPDIVFFGENLPEEFFLAIPELRRCDLLIVIGTSLQVHPFAGLVNQVRSTTPRLLINREAVGPFTSLRGSTSRGRDSAWLGDADDGVRLLARNLGWEQELDDLIAKGRRELAASWARRESLSLLLPGMTHSQEVHDKHEEKEEEEEDEDDGERDGGDEEETEAEGAEASSEDNEGEEKGALDNAASLLPALADSKVPEAESDIVQLEQAIAKVDIGTPTPSTQGANEGAKAGMV